MKNSRYICTKTEKKKTRKKIQVPESEVLPPKKPILCVSKDIYTKLYFNILSMIEILNEHLGFLKS